MRLAESCVEDEAHAAGGVFALCTTCPLHTRNETRLLTEFMDFIILLPF